jgi:hypothetical protein
LNSNDSEQQSECMSNPHELPSYKCSLKLEKLSLDFLDQLLSQKEHVDDSEQHVASMKQTYHDPKPVSSKRRRDEIDYENIEKTSQN